MEYNAPATGEKYREIARAMGVKGVDEMTQEEYRKAAINAVKQLSHDVGIPADLKNIVKERISTFWHSPPWTTPAVPATRRIPPKRTSSPVQIFAVSKSKKVPEGFRNLFLLQGKFVSEHL